MLTIADISKSYGATPVLDNVSFQVRTGERAGLVGPNGAGKSTLLRIIAGALPADRGKVSIGPGMRLAYLQQDAGVQPGRTVHEELASIFGALGDIEHHLKQIEHQIAAQANDDVALERLVNEQADLLAEFERLDGHTIEARIGTILSGLGFAQRDHDRQTQEFSGGWQMRIALAKLLLSAPEVLLLDEPTNHLDLAAVEWLEGFLVESRSSVLIVSHDRYFLDRVTQRTIELELGSVTDYPMAYTAYTIERARREEAQLAAFNRQQEYLSTQQAFVERFRASATKSTAAKSREKMLDRVERVERPRPRRKIAFRFRAARPSGASVYSLKGTAKSYGTHVVLDRVDLELERGERIGLVGPNGAGKSTLLRLLANVEAADRGRVALGHNVQMAYFSQTQAKTLDDERTVLESIEQIAPPGMTRTETRELLGGFLFQQDEVFKKVAVLSGGERSRLALARMLLTPANLLLLDEPTNHLDISAREVLEDALSAYAGTVVIASHDRYLLDRVATRIVDVGGGALTSYFGNYTRYRDRKAQLLAAGQLSSSNANRANASEGGPKSLLQAPSVETQSKASRADMDLAAARIDTLNGGAITDSAVRSDDGIRGGRTNRERPERAKRDAESRLAKVETEVERLASRRAELESRLTDPTLWADALAASMLVEELETVQAAIEEATTRWESLTAVH